MKLVVDTSKDAFGEEMQLVPMVGGSGPSYAFVHTLKLPVVTTGLATRVGTRMPLMKTSGSISI